MNFAALLADRARNAPDSPALRDKDVRHSASELWAIASALARRLRLAGVGEGARVAVLLPHGAPAAAALFGVMAMGGVVVPIAWTATSHQVDHILRDTGAASLVTTASAARRLGGMASSLPLLLVESLEGEAFIELADVRPHDLALILFTSGSTGAPRGVMVSHENLWASVGPVVRYLGLVASDRLASVLPFSFTYGLGQLTCALAAGAELVVIDPTFPADTIESLRVHGCTVLATIPPGWLQLLGTARLQTLPSLRIATCAGGRLSPDAVAAVRRALPQVRLYLMYGFTEVFRSAYLAPDEVDAHPDAMGRPIEGARLEVLDESGRPCGDDEVGELVHAGPTVTLGYWNDPEATGRRYLELPGSGAGAPPLRAARSGDLVRRAPSGLFYFVGRKDHLIKTLGMRVSPDEVTDALLATQLVNEAAVSAEPDALRGQRIVAHVVLRAGATLESVRRAAATLLPRHMQPARWVEHASLPRTSRGKYDLALLWSGKY